MCTCNSVPVLLVFLKFPCANANDLSRLLVAVVTICSSWFCFNRKMCGRIRDRFYFTFCFSYWFVVSSLQSKFFEVQHCSLPIPGPVPFRSWGPRSTFLQWFRNETPFATGGLNGIGIILERDFSFLMIYFFPEDETYLYIASLSQ